MNQFWELFSAAHPLVHIDAALNSLATLLLVIGFVLIKRGNIEGHKRAMFAALATSALFLACYLTYHLALGRETKFPMSGGIRTFYLALLASHVILAMAVPFLAIATIIQGMRSQGSWLPSHVREATEVERAEYIEKCRRRHVELAKVAFPIWMYVSITGVLVYVMLYYVGPSLVEG